MVTDKQVKKKEREKVIEIEFDTERDKLGRKREKELKQKE